MKIAAQPLEQNKCYHEPDPDTIVYDKKVGKRAICIKCGKPIVVITKMHRVPGEKTKKTMKITSSDKREAKRRNYDATKKTES